MIKDGGVTVRKRRSVIEKRFIGKGNANQESLSEREELDLGASRVENTCGKRQLHQKLRRWRRGSEKGLKGTYHGRIRKSPRGVLPSA